MDYVPLPRPGRLWRSKTDFWRPFRGAATGAGEHITPLYDPDLHRQLDDEPDLRTLNGSLATLLDVFPDIEPDVCREMLLSISEESRVEVVTERILNKDAKWVRGRRVSAEDEQRSRLRRPARPSDVKLAAEDAFRSESYKKAVKQVCYQEFRNLSRSAVKAVLAEHNHSYSLSRPVLQQLTTRSWRFTLSSLWTKRSPSASTVEHPFITRHTDELADRCTSIAVKRTGDAHLDHEIWELLVRPEIRMREREQLQKDHAYANQVVEDEAREVDALFDCECCFNPVPFEQVTVCDHECHQLCFDCVRRTVKEALYGQGWAKAADTDKNTVRCFAPTATASCEGCLPAQRVRLALWSANGDTENAWDEFQARVTNDVLIKSRLRLQRCPFCSYAEVDELPTMRLRDGKAFLKHVTTRSSAAVQLVIFLFCTAMLVCTVPLLLLASAVWFAIRLVPPAAASIDASWSRVYKTRQGLKFKCCNAHCCKISCLRCDALWRDPHTCFEDEKTSLRTAIESSATAAVKRTCPRCMLSFVKSSGCNKLVCNCGYTMCYICRQEITSKEGYSHFCQHFRPNGGRCGECERCDLYGDEDEAVAIRHAANAAEKAWREREGCKGDARAAELMVQALVGQGGHGRWWEQWLDALLDAMAA